jgi:hypothetical protein
MRTGKFILAVAVGLGMTLTASMASAQLNSGAQPIALNATLNESLTVTLDANAVNFALTAGSATNPGITGVTSTTTWTLASGRTAVGVYAYFTNAAQALSFGTNYIPSSAFSIADNGGAATPLTSTVPFATNAGYQMENVAITNANRSGSATDVMTFNIDLSGGTLPQLPAGTYTGTLNIQAQATP